MVIRQTEMQIPEDSSRLLLLEPTCGTLSLDSILDALRNDLVVLVRNISADQADHVIFDVANGLQLATALDLQACFATSLGHRHNVGKYFMTVNTRGDYQFIPPHSEGSSFSAIQLAAFFCYDNSTDGGESILMNIDGSSSMWPCLREFRRRGRLEPAGLAPHETARVRGLYQLDMPADTLREDDLVLKEHATSIPGLMLFDVLAKPVKTYSHILGTKRYAYWDSIGSIDFDSAKEYVQLLRECGLLKEPYPSVSLSAMDYTHPRRVWHSGVRFEQLFKCKVTHKLTPGDLIIQNNITWTHATSNWSPNSGKRRIVAAFA